MNIMENTIAELVVKNYKTAAIFKRHGIDFCCGGKISISEACDKQGVHQETLLKELQEALHMLPEKNDAASLELDELTRYIVDTHHNYVRQRIPEIEPFLEKVIRVHGEKHPELKQVRELFDAIKEELLTHMQKEENVLFPYIRTMVEAQNTQKTIEAPHFGTIKNPIRVMEHEHELAGDKCREIRNLTQNLTPPEGACNTYRVTFAMLDEFENDLHRHVHLENNILFPQSTQLEETLLPSA
jgi:regulator of cell morphogenesis and NO signaling